MAFPSEPVSIFWQSALRPSHRSPLERWVGLGILLALAFAFQAFEAWIARSSMPNGWLPNTVLWTIFSGAQAFSFWTLWRRHSLHRLKFELSVYLSQFALSSLWSVSLFLWQETLLSLVALLLQTFATLLCVLVFWKKERFSGQWMTIGLAWGLYLSSLNMAVCLYNP